MKYIIIPTPVPMEQIDGTPIQGKSGQIKLSFKEFVEGRLCDPKMAVTADTMFIAFEVRTKVRATDIGHIALEDAHYAQLLDVTNTPSPQAQYNPQVAHCLLPHIKAIRDAKDTAPVAATDNAVDEVTN